MLKISHLTVRLKKKKILKDISFNFQKGKLYAIMGPNGSGKSTLAMAIMGHPTYTLARRSKITFISKNITSLESHKRAKQGIFLSFQSPLSLSGVTVYQFMRYALDGKMGPVEIRRKIKQYAAELSIAESLLSRSLNEGASGGEKKKLEILQAVMLSPKLAIFDEIDTGVDVDAMKHIASFIKKMKTRDKTIILITHYNRILKYLSPDKVLVMIGGKIVKTGSRKLAERIERHGYDKIKPQIKN
ncbi:MAG: Fe-S cluster assembly ATPase SufC [Candidatus Paceibacterota bacterium]